MKTNHLALPAICVCVLLTSFASAATIKKKDGQEIKGEINGRVVLKGKTLESDSRYKHSVTFIVMDGKDINTIDENGVNSIKGQTFPTFLYYFDDEQAPGDTWILSLGEKFLAVGSDVTMNIAGGLLAIRRFEGRNLTDTLLGELVKEGKDVRIRPSLQVNTDKGPVEIGIAEIANFKTKK
ncbi:MAG: hypothetical protein ACMG6H_03415 [Acidobacteriota bacterium]